MQAMQTIGAQQAAGRALRPVPQHKPPETGLRTQRIEITGQQIVRLANGGGLLALGTRAVPITGNSAVPSMALLRALAAENVRAAATLLTMAGNTGVGGQRVQMDETTRFESRPGEFTGRMYDRMPDGSWQAREGGYVGFAVEMGFRVLSEEELRNLRAPITTPALPPGNTSPPPLPVRGRDGDNGTPGYMATPPAVGTPGMAAAPPVMVDDLITESRIVGPLPPGQVPVGGNGGPGSWVQVEETMSASARDHQAAATGAPPGSGYAVTNPNTGKEVVFDGYSNGALIDAKDRYAQFINKDGSGFNEWFRGQDGLRDEAIRQEQAANGAPVEWRFSDKNTGKFFESWMTENGFNIRVVYPKE
jgi:Restriction endonuclease fold toxin 5